jgi:hypothetical protein
VGIDVFNLFNFQAETRRDETYTRAAVLPIVDEKGKSGTTKDLPTRDAEGNFQCDPATCKLKYSETGGTFDPVDINPNFGNPLAFQSPRQFRFSAKVSF